MNESTQLPDRASSRSPRLFTPLDRAGLVVLVVGLLASLWLTVAPFLVGGALAVLMVAMIVWLIGGSLLELSRSAPPRQRDHASSGTSSGYHDPRRRRQLLPQRPGARRRTASHPWCQPCGGSEEGRSPRSASGRWPRPDAGIAVGRPCSQVR